MRIPGHQSETFDRLAYARERAGYASAADAARALNIPEPTYQGHENGSRGLKKDVADRYAKFFGVSFEWLITGRGKPETTTTPRLHMGNTPDHLPAINGDIAPGLIEIGRTEFALIGRYDAALSAGPGCLLDTNAEPLGYHPIELQWLRSVTQAAPDHLALVRVDGDSMEPTFFNNDWVLIDRVQRRVSRQGIYAIRVGDDAWIKRLMVDLPTKQIQIISDNPRYHMQMMPHDDLDLVGRYLALIWRRSTA